MQETVLKLEKLGGRANEGKAASAARTIAMAEMASGRYKYAASQYDTFAASGSATWEDAPGLPMKICTTADAGKTLNSPYRDSVTPNE